MLATRTRTLELHDVALPLAAPFRIAGYVFEQVPVLLATLRDGAHAGRGEAAGVYYLGDGPAQMRAAIEGLRTEIEDGLDRAALRTRLPPGGARNALDCALWELEARRAGVPVWKLAGRAPPRPLLTTFTLGADQPDAMARGARALAHARALKLKLTGDVELDIDRVRAVRVVRPDVWLGVDANQAYVPATLQRLIPVLIDARVELLEQPCARGAESELDGVDRTVPIAADESVQGLDELEPLVGRFDVVNIKLDKCGGLTEGLLMADAARRLGLRVMVGNMIGSSLAMAPGFVLGQCCDIVDLDGAQFLRRDCEPGVGYAGGYIQCADAVWGGSEPASPH